MERVTGIGGIFFKARDPEMLRNWYREHLGIDVQSWGGTAFPWNEPGGLTTWSIFPATTEYLGAGPSPFMVNYRVKDLAALIAALRAEGCAVDEKVDESEYGKFGWVTDPEGNRIELWEPPKEQAPG
jgi:predicted enzyme related to lactoylglutathione lyase